jgi:hypothetical protein
MASKKRHHRTLTPDRETTALIKGAHHENLLFFLPPWKFIEQAHGRPSGAALDHQNGKALRPSFSHATTLATKEEQREIYSIFDPKSKLKKMRERTIFRLARTV